MICGVFTIQIIDAQYGSPKHACPQYDAIAIGSQHDNGMNVEFVAEFNVLNPYSRLYLDMDTDSISGAMHMSYEKDVRKQIMTLIPIDKALIKEAIVARAPSITGGAVMEYTPSFTANVLPVTYTLDYRWKRALIHRVHITVPIKLLQQTQRVISNLEQCRLCEL